MALSILSSFLLQNNKCWYPLYFMELMTSLIIWLPFYKIVCTHQNSITRALFDYYWRWIHFLFLFSKLFIFCFSNLVFIFSTQPISCLALFSSLVFASSFFFFFQLKIYHSWERECFFMGQINVRGTHRFGFLRKYHYIQFQEN